MQKMNGVLMEQKGGNQFMQRFYEVVYIWSDGDKVTDAIYADSLDEAIDIARKEIADSATEARELEGYGEDEDYIAEIQFWNNDEDDIFCTVTEDEVFMSDTVPEYPQWIG